MRTPNGTEILPIGFRVGAAESAVDYLSEPCLYDAAQACNNASFVPGDDTVPGDSTAVSSFSAELCFASARGNDYAKLILGGAGQQRAIELDLQGGVSCA